MQTIKLPVRSAGALSFELFETSLAQSAEEAETDLNPSPTPTPGPGPGPGPSPSPSPNLQQEDIVERGEGEELPPQVVARLGPAALRLHHEDVGRRAHLVRVSGQG